MGASKVRGGTLSLLMAFLGVAPGGAHHSEAARVPVTWAFEAPDMPDASEFNESGTVLVPIEYDPAECRSQISVVDIHVYQYITGSTRRRDHMPSCISSGTMVSITKDIAGAAPRVTVRLEAGNDDWTSEQDFDIPQLSPAQWNDLATTTSWGFSGRMKALPRFAKRVVVSCR